MSNHFQAGFGLDLSQLPGQVAQANAYLQQLGHNVRFDSSNVERWSSSIRELADGTRATTVNVNALNSSFQKLKYTQTDYLRTDGSTFSTMRASVDTGMRESIKSLNTLHSEQQRVRSNILKLDKAIVKEGGTGPVADAMRIDADAAYDRLLEIKRTVANYDDIVVGLSKFGDGGKSDRDFQARADSEIRMANIARQQEIEKTQVGEVNKLYAQRSDLVGRVEASQARLASAGAAERRVLRENIQEYQTGIQQVNAEISQYTPQIVAQADATGALVKEEEYRRQAALQTAQAYDQQVAKLKQIAQRINQVIVMLGARMMYQGLKEAVDYAGKYHNILNEIQVVTMKSKSEVDALGVTFRRMANELKTPSSEIAGSAVEWYRQGLNDQQVKQRLTESTKLARVAAISIEESTRLITTAINSGMVDTAERATDVLVALGDAAATDAEEIGQAMQRSAASAQAAGVSYEWLATYITIISERTRLSADIIGTTMRSMFARLQQIKEAGFNTEDSTNINMIERAFANINRELGTNMTLLEADRKTWRSLPEVFNEIAMNWEDMNDKQRSYLMTQLAGVRQQDRMLALMFGLAEEFDDTTRGAYLYSIAMESAGTTNDKFAISMESVSAAQSDFRASLEELYTTIISGDTVKEFYDVLINVTNAFTAGLDAMGGFNVELIATIGGVIAATAVIAKLGGAISGIVTAFSAKTLAAGLVTGFASLGAALPAIAIALVGITAAVVYFKGEAQKTIDPVKDLGTELDRLETSRSKWDDRILALNEYKGMLYDLSLSTADAATKQETYNRLMAELITNYPGLAEVLKDTAGNWVSIADAINVVLGKMSEYSKARDAEMLANANRVATAAGAEMAPIVQNVKDLREMQKFLQSRHYLETGQHDKFMLSTDPTDPNRAPMLPSDELIEFIKKNAVSLGYQGETGKSGFLGPIHGSISDDYYKWLTTNFENYDAILQNLIDIQLRSADVKIDQFNESLSTMLTAQEGFRELPSFLKDKLMSDAEKIAADVSAEDLMGMSAEEIGAMFGEKRNEMAKVVQGYLGDLPSLTGEFIASIWGIETGRGAHTPYVKHTGEQLAQIFGMSLVEAQTSMEGILKNPDISAFWTDFITDWTSGSISGEHARGILNSMNSPFEVFRFGIKEKIDDLSVQFNTDAETLQKSLDRITEVAPDMSGASSQALEDFYNFLSGPMVSKVRFDEFMERLSVDGSDLSAIGSQVRSWITLPSGSGVGEGEAGTEKVLSLSEAYQKITKSATDASVALQHATAMTDIISSVTDASQMQDAATALNDYFMKIPEQYHKTMYDLMPELDKLMEDMEARSTTVGAIGDRVNVYNKNIFASQLKQLEEMGVAYEGVSEIISQLGTEDAANAKEALYDITRNSVPKLMEALASWELLKNGGGSREQIDDAYSKVAAAIGVSVETLKLDMVGANRMLTAETDTLLNTMTLVARELEAIYPNVFGDEMMGDSAALMARLRELNSWGNEYAETLFEMASGMQMYGNTTLDFTRGADGLINFTQSSSMDRKSFDQMWREYSFSKPDEQQKIASLTAQSFIDGIMAIEDNDALLSYVERFENLALKMGDAREAVFDLLPDLNKLFSGIKDGTIDVTNLDKAMLKTASTMNIQSLEGMENVGMSVKGVSDALKEYQVSTYNGNTAMATNVENAEKLSLALYNLRAIQNGQIISTDRLAAAQEQIGGVVGMDVTDVATNMTRANELLMTQRRQLFNSMLSLSRDFTDEEKEILQSDDGWRETLAARGEGLSIYAKAFLELQRGFEQTEGMTIKIVEDPTGTLRFLEEAVISISTLQETFNALRENAGFTEEDTSAAAGGMFSVLFGATTQEDLQTAAGSIETMWKGLSGAQAEALAKMLPGFDAYIAKIASGEIKLEDLRAASKGYIDILARDQLRAQERAGNSLAGLSGIMDDFAEGNLVRANENLTKLAMTGIPRLMRGLNSMERIKMDGATMSAEELAAAWAEVGDAIGVSGEEAAAAPTQSLGLLMSQAYMTTNALNILGGSMLAVGGASFSAANWQAELAALAGSGDTAALAVYALIQAIQGVEGAEITATTTENGGLKFDVKGLGTAPTTTTKRSAGGGGGGGGKQEKSAIQIWLDDLKKVKDIDDFRRSLLGLKQDYFDTAGELTNLIDAYQREIDMIKERDVVDRANLKAIEDRMTAQQALVASMKTTDKQYSQAVSDLDALQKAHQDYSKVVQQNSNDLQNLEKSIKSANDAIREQEIEIFELVRTAVKAEEERERSMLDGRIAMEEEVLKVLRDRYKKQWELIQEDLDKKRDALNRQKSLLSEELQARKDAARTADKYEKLIELQEQLARISADPTRSKDRIKIEGEIAKIREELSWEAAEEEVKSQQKSIDDQLEALEIHRQKLEEYYTNLLENPRALAEEMSRIFRESDAELIEWATKNIKGFKDMTIAEQEAMVNTIHQMAYMSEGKLLEWMTANVIGFSRMTQDEQRLAVDNLEIMVANANNSAAVLSSGTMASVREALGSSTEDMLNWAENNIEGFSNLSTAEQARILSEMKDLSTATSDEVRTWLEGNVSGFKDFSKEKQDALVSDVKTLAEEMYRNFRTSNAEVIAWATQNIKDFNNMTFAEQEAMVNAIHQTAYMSEERLLEWMTANVAGFSKMTQEEQQLAANNLKTMAANANNSAMALSNGAMAGLRQAFGSSTENMLTWARKNIKDFSDLSAAEQARILSEMKGLSTATSDDVRKWLEDNVSGFKDFSKEEQDALVSDVETLAKNSNTSVVAWLQQNSNEYANATDAQRTKMTSEWTQGMLDMRGATFTNWNKINTIILGGQESIIDYLKNNHPDYREAGDLQSNAYVDEWKGKLADLEAAYKSTQDYMRDNAYVPPPDTSGSGTGGGSGGTPPKQYGYQWKDSSGTWIDGAKNAKQQTAFDTAKAEAIKHWGQKTGPGVSEVMRYLGNATMGAPSSYLKAYKKGGYIDYTGPAMVHGTYSDPEYMLNAGDTKMLESLINVLRNVYLPGIGRVESNARSDEGKNTFVEKMEVTLNIDKVDSRERIEELTELVVQQIGKELTNARGVAVGGVNVPF